MIKRNYKEVLNPKQEREYWAVYNPADELPHYFKTKEDAYNYASYNNIEDINIIKECFN